MLTPWLPVPHVKQRQDADCLAACAAMVLDYLQRPLNYDQLLKRLDITPDVGAPASRLKRLAVLNLTVIYEAGDLDTLAAYLSQYIPCIVFVDTIHLGYWSESARHALVVIGLDDERVYLNDPFFEQSPQVISRLEFELAWDEMDNLYAVITK